ncbi:hypothetical protein AXE65_04215 [Ventosimonas gracilis]|uniref:Conjugal transfer protein TrbL n=1 Tax=Ventosimonas gracilis TaxID=1680762 RepID=A0A139SR86_9GAMM|nr:P-type conjugative transfer protein TrbL [Ventosimonas gracilis]KXU36990.1 hypothetical protein AXE65_04215 [Ventosimonas gracilis]
MRPATIRSALPYLLPLILLVFSLDASAELSSQGLMDDVLKKFKDQTMGWGDTFKQHASWLFLTLATISMVWTFGMLALRKADISEFFAELIRFAIFVGFFWWLLDNGPTFAHAIIDSLTQMGGKVNQGSGYEAELTPSGIVDIGFEAIEHSLKTASWRSPFTSLAGFVFAFGILLLSVMIGMNMLMLLISAWVLAYAGIFILGFGGSRWTQDMAINYYRTVLNTGLQIMTMLLLVGIGKALMREYFESVSAAPTITEMAIVFVVAFIVYHLSSKVPSLIAGMASGGGGGGDMGIGGSGGAAMGAAMGMAGAGIAASSAGKAATKAATTPVTTALASGVGLAKAASALDSSIGQDAKRQGGGTGAFMKAAGIHASRTKAKDAEKAGMLAGLEP